MVLAKHHLLRIFFVIEVVVFVGLYLFGAHGVRMIRDLQNDNEYIEQEVAALQQEVDVLDVEINAWNEHPFYREKIAREQLQMARQGDEVYYIK